MITKIKSELNQKLNQTFSEFSQGIKPMMKSYFDSLNALLSELVENTDSKIKQKHYMESMHSIKVHKLNVMVSYLKTLQDTFKNFANNEFDFFKDLYSYQKNKAIKSSSNGFEIEGEFIQNNLRYKFEQQYLNQLAALHSGFSRQVNGSLEPKANPISPYVLISAFAKSIRLLHLDENIQAILYQHYSRTILSNLETLYDGAIKNLSNNNKISETNLSNPQINGHRYTIASSKLNEVIGELELNLSKSLKIFPQNIKTELMTKIEHVQLSESRHIDAHDLYNINFVCMRFQVIANNSNIHETIKNNLYKLQIPFLKYLIQDDTFVENKSHPAQLLLDMLVNSSIGWSEKSDLDREFINKIKNTVTIFGQTEVFTESFFKSTLKNYQEFVTHQESKFASEQKRIKKREVGKTQIVAAMKTVDALIELKTASTTLPKFVQNILFGPWKNLLSLLLVRYSDTSKEYLKRIDFVDSLITLLDSSQYGFLVEDKIVSLSLVYKKGLKLVAYNGEVLDGKVKKFTDDLMKHHKLGKYNVETKSGEHLKNSNDIDTNRYEKEPASKKLPQKTSTQPKPPMLEGVNKIDAYLLEKVKIGVWVELLRLNKEPIKAQLSWINPKSGKYIFVNDRGLKVTDKNQNEMLTDLKANRIIVLK